MKKLKIGKMNGSHKASFAEQQSEMELALKLLETGAGRAHFVGVCGIGMAGLAFLLASKGFRVSGCDAAPSDRIAAWLASNGVELFSGQNSSHVEGSDWFVRSSAVGLDHPELQAARESGIPILRRGAVLAALLTGYCSIIVSGSHGKTTISAMIVQMLIELGLDPSFCIGGESEALGAVAGAGRGRIMVAEADESDGTLACYRPDIAVVSNIEFDHAEYYAGLEELVACYETLLSKTAGKIICCADDPVASKLCRGRAKSFSYGFKPSAGLRVIDSSMTGEETRLTLLSRGSQVGELVIKAIGKHNALNSLAACSVGLALGCGFDEIKKGLSRFAPVKRRFERLPGPEASPAILDYAHHPTEIKALIESARLLKPSRWTAIFQPHRYTRTRALGPGFVRAFEGVHETIILPVYEASEQQLAGGTASDLYALFRNTERGKVSIASSARQAWRYWRARKREDEGLLVIGAGDVARIRTWAFAEAANGRDAGCATEQLAEELSRLNLRETELKINEPMAEKTTLRVGGESDIFASVGCEADLALLLSWAGRRRVATRVIGRGSNLLVSDLGFRGIVIRLDRSRFGTIREGSKGSLVCGGAAPLSAVTRRLVEARKKGLLFLSGIPGTVGGALRMNAGAWGSAIGDQTAWVRVMNRDGSTQKLGIEDLQFAYRQCGSLRGRIVLEAGLLAERGSPSEIEDEIERIAERRAWMLGLRTAGSVFRNPENDNAGRLIELAGLKGLEIGGARVSERHGNVIVVEPSATASDVSALIEMIRSEVKVHSGVALEKEIVCLL